jgi:murein DD-endopeptidase MepM/ murein hydrolase activator NlpD
MVDEAGNFLVGFGRDSGPSALIVATLPGGETVRRSLDIAKREFKVDRIDGLDQSKVSGYTEEQLAKIAVDSAKKKEARADTQAAADWVAGFAWPVTGRISGVFGSQRILNGEPKNPHSGVDVAAPTGTPIRAPAPGIVRLAETDMYFEGGLVLLDHGQWLESAFLHMSRIDVEPGQRVEKGDVIGAVGATGRVTGPHLHWSLKWVGRLVDPQLLVGDMETAAVAAGKNAGE